MSWLDDRIASGKASNLLNLNSLDNQMRRLQEKHDLKRENERLKQSLNKQQPLILPTLPTPPPQPKDNTLMYVGIGIGAIALVGIATILILRR